MSQLLNEAKAEIRSERRQVRQRRKFLKRNELHILALVQELELDNASSARLTCDTEDANLYVTGNTAVLKELFRAFRKLGYEPSSRPDTKPQSSFTTYFSQDGKPTFYLSFSSTLCKRVKIGTKMVEQDIYEVQCE